MDGDLLAWLGAVAWSALLLLGRCGCDGLAGLLGLLLGLHHALPHLGVLHGLRFHALDILRDGEAVLLRFGGDLLLHLSDLLRRGLLSWL